MLSRFTLTFALIIFAFALALFGSTSSGALVSNDVEEPGPPVPGTNAISGSGSGQRTRARLQKNRVRGPADLGLYYVNNPGNCGGMSTSVCSKDCGALGYPVYWCYAKLCYCHFG